MTEQQQKEAQLSLRKQVNFPYLLATQILTFQQATLAKEFSEREIVEAINGFIHLIPDAWKDDTFNEESKAAISQIKVDISPIVAGRTRMDEATCKELGIPKYDMQEKKDHYKLFQACINLLNRRGLLMKENPTQKIEREGFNKHAEIEV